MKKRTRQENRGICTQTLSTKAGGTSPPQQAGGQTGMGRAGARRPGHQVSATTRGAWLESAASAKYRILGALVFSRDSCRAL